ncbi:hypothetical protein [Acidocella facilis]|uniref:hypothetical protein n=1 Tax=Acidocella facilis TaxID=525 RepID=UPI0012DD6AA1|nr:hypothetical protein [Acidocella facilis]
MNYSLDENKINDLRELYQSSPAAAAVLNWAANRTNDSLETSIDRLAVKADIERGPAIWVAKQLQEIGCGTFVVGRKGARSRFVWEYSLKSVGLAAQGNTTVLSGVDPEAVEDGRDQTASARHIDEEMDEALPEDDTHFSPSEPLTIAKAKALLAISLGVSKESIEIIIRS